MATRLVKFTAVSSGVISLLMANPVGAADKVTYEDNVLPIFRSNCLKCHNPDKAKGDLDLSVFPGVIKGGGSGASVVSGDPDGSKLVKSITHAEEPNMPPNSKLPDKDIEVIKKWIAGGLLETSGSKAIAASKPKVDLTLNVSAVGKPDGPPPMPADLLLEPKVRTEKTSVMVGLANSPWAPLVALGGQHQVLLYNTDTLELAGVLPFPEGYPMDIKFSRNGKLVLAGGGHAAKLGLVTVWDVTNGERIITVGDEYDSVLAADISGDQKWIALGGPSKLVKIYSTKDGQLEHTIKKHTDWVTALEFSPDSKLLATGDRNGNLLVWEAATGEELYTLKGHRGAITSISWRADSEFALSASEDGSVKVWKVKDEQAVKTWTAHGDGALSAHYTQDGRIVSCGRDKSVVVWDMNGARKSSFKTTNDIPVRATFSYDGARVVASDWVGRVYVFNSNDGKEIGELASNPPSLTERIASVTQEITRLESQVEQNAMAVAAAEADLAKVEGAQTNSKLVDAAKKKIEETKNTLEQSKRTLAQTQFNLAELKAAEFNVKVYQAKDELAKLQRDYEKLLSVTNETRTTVTKANADIIQAKKDSVTVAGKIQEQRQAVKVQKKLADKVGDDFKKADKDTAKATTKLEKASADLAKLQADAGKAPEDKKLAEKLAALQKTVESLKTEQAASKKISEEKQVAADKATKDLESARKELAKAETSAGDLTKRIKSLGELIKKSEAEGIGAKLAAEKAAKELASTKDRVEKLVAEYKRLKPTAQESGKTAKL